MLFLNVFIYNGWNDGIIIPHNFLYKLFGDLLDVGLI